MKKSIITFGVCFVTNLLPVSADSGIGWISYPGGKGPGQGKHVVLISGDEEYRSEEGLPMLAKILSERQGFQCTVLFSTDADGTINPNKSESLGKPEALDTADAIVTLIRFRKWPDAAMKHFDDAILRGVPIVALRTSTHSFQLPDSSSFKAYNNYGKEVLGEGWVAHWGNHKSEATRGMIEPDSKNSPLLQGVADLFATTDVYEAHPPVDAKILVRGQVLAGMKPTDAPAAYEKKRSNDQQTQDVNSPMIPIAWQRVVKNTAGKTNKVLCTTLGAATDLANEDLRRLIINGVLWGAGVVIPTKTNVTLVGDYHPSTYDFDGFKKNTKSEDYK
jgi:Trehalose utilisation